MNDKLIFPSYRIEWESTHSHNLNQENSETTSSIKTIMSSIEDFIEHNSSDAPHILLYWNSCKEQFNSLETSEEINSLPLFALLDQLEDLYWGSELTDIFFNNK
jgi:hypothetical protein